MKERDAPLSMYIPDQYRASNRPSVRRCLTGLEVNPKVVVFTPIRSLFSAILPNDLANSSSGWWEAKYSSVLNVSVVLTPQASPIVDLLACLEPGTNVILVGIAGALRDLDIGDIVEVSSSHVCGTKFFSSLDLKSSFKKASIATVSSLAETESRINELRGICNCADMETGILFSLSGEYHLKAASLQVISDSVLNQPFYNTGEDAYEKSMSILTSWINTNIGNFLK
ncbi:purine-nucleoside phosphorylase [Prosthecochloris sp. GSB1]|uniref:purine-nucleoside phosphorylase n=1 Tax=Prosthecochloris sp. GSB1 TaxID=281093 RepID=UPI00142D1F22|nr:purine-nucleoside phosphorylase [Prosthecochloris sp. GSB1]